MITKRELNSEINILRSFGLTLEEIEGYLEFYKEIFKIEDFKYRRTQVLNTKRGLK